MDKVEYKDSTYEVYTEDKQGWTNFLNTLSEFYASKPKLLPKVNVHVGQEIICSEVKEEKEDYYIVNNIPSFGSDLKRFYGTTNSLNEIGYILPDGSALDFSGRHLKYGLIKWDYVQGRKGITHDNVLGINNDGYCLTKDYRELLWSSHSFSQAIILYARAVRVGFGLDDVEPFINLSSKMTDQQIDVLLSHCEGQTVIVDYTDSEVMPMFDRQITLNKESLLDLNKDLPYRV